MTLLSSCGSFTGQCELPSSVQVSNYSGVSALVPGADSNGFNFTVLPAVLVANGSCLFVNVTEPSTGDVVSLELCLSALVELDSSGATVTTVSAVGADFGSQPSGSVDATGSLGFGGGVLSNGAGLNMLYTYYEVYGIWKGQEEEVRSLIAQPIMVVCVCGVCAVDKTTWRRWCCWGSWCRCR